MTPTSGGSAPRRFATLTDYLRYATRGITGPLGSALGKLGIDPNALTLAGLLPAALSALLAANGQFLAAGLALLIGAPLDALDGAVARAMNKVSRFGAFLDSTTDRYGEGFLFAGIAYFYAGRADSLAVGLAFLALIGSFAVSYTRARAEGLDVGSIKDGVFDRVVRMLILIGMLLTGWIVPGLFVLAVGTNLTALQRILIARRALQNDPPAA